MTRFIIPPKKIRDTGGKFTGISARYDIIWVLLNNCTSRIEKGAETKIIRTRLYIKFWAAVVWFRAFFT